MECSCTVVSCDFREKWDSDLSSTTKSKLSVHHDPINPHTDIAAPGKHKIEIRMVKSATQRGQDIITHESELACIYTPQGRCMGQISVPCLDKLYKDYCHTKTHSPALWEKLQPQDFATEVYRLMIRYKEGYQHSKTSSRTIKLKNHWATPAPVMCVLREHLGISMERFASPLNHSPHIPHYCSMYEDDQVFGARHDAYGWKWQGISEANPEYEDEEMEKAV